MTERPGPTWPQAVMVVAVMAMIAVTMWAIFAVALTAEATCAP